MDNKSLSSTNIMCTQNQTIQIPIYFIRTLRKPFIPNVKIKGIFFLANIPHKKNQASIEKKLRNFLIQPTPSVVASTYSTLLNKKEEELRNYISQ